MTTSKRPGVKLAGGRGLVVLLAGAAACVATPAPTGDGLEFVALGPAFKGFSSWTSQTIDDGAAAGATHVSGKRTIYINMLPPAGATEFPVGTIIVKRTDMDGKIFARAKRGDYNQTGAVGWEWFELIETKTTHEVAIKWRGVGPPLGEVYGGDPNAGCNACHKVATANDYVLAPGLRLATMASDAAAPDGEGPDAEAGAADGGATDDGAATETGSATDAGTDTGAADDATHE